MQHRFLPGMDAVGIIALGLIVVTNLCITTEASATPVLWTVSPIDTTQTLSLSFETPNFECTDQTRLLVAQELPDGEPDEVSDELPPGVDPDDVTECGDVDEDGICDDMDAMDEI